MRPYRHPLFAGLLLAGLAAAFPARACPPVREPAARARLQPIRYHRTGGLRGENFWIEVTADGRMRSYSLAFRDGREVRRDVRTGRLTAAQARQLAGVFQGWNRLKDRYLPPRAVPDGRTMQLRYGRKTVIAGDGAPGIPAVFERAERTLDALARKVCRPTPDATGQD